ncbi:MAG: hypothetical protein M1836_002172 [Candelina mexicana]|nr:MAG: hypothetical protein M1836_002172 [Candelina mexicana]
MEQETKLDDDGDIERVVMRVLQSRGCAAGFGGVVQVDARNRGRSGGAKFGVGGGGGERRREEVRGRVRNGGE